MKYEIDLESLFKKKPPIYGVEDGKYVVDLDSAFIKQNKEKKKTRIYQEISLMAVQRQKAKWNQH